ncbi:hypothetical protein ES703_102776 [subsurface metagenome]
MKTQIAQINKQRLHGLKEKICLIFVGRGGNFEFLGRFVIHGEYLFVPILYLAWTPIMNDKDTPDTVCSSGQSEDSKKPWPSGWWAIIRRVPTVAGWVIWISRGLYDHMRIRLTHQTHMHEWRKRRLIIDNPPQNLEKFTKVIVLRQPQTQSAKSEFYYVKDLLRSSSRVGIISRHSTVLVRVLLTLLQTRRYLKPIQRSPKWPEVLPPRKNYLTPPTLLVYRYRRYEQKRKSI